MKRETEGRSTVSQQGSGSIPVVCNYAIIQSVRQQYTKNNQTITAQDKISGT